MRRLPTLAVTLTALVALAGCASPRESWWGRDKLLHLSTATGLSAAATFVQLEAGQDESDAQLQGVGVVLVLGAAKETRDHYQANNVWSWKDMTWNVIGAILGSQIARTLHEGE